MSEHCNAQDGPAWEQLAVEFVDGVLSEDAARQAEERLRRDARFRAAVQAQQAWKQLVAKLDPPASVPATFYPRLMQRLKLLAATSELWQDALLSSEDASPWELIAQAYADRQLPDSTRRLIQQHLAHDETLREQVQHILLLKQLLQSQVTEPVGSTFHARVLERLQVVASARAAEAAAARWRRAAAALLPWRWHPLAAAAAAVATVAAAAAGIWLQVSMFASQPDAELLTPHTDLPVRQTERPFAEAQTGPYLQSSPPPQPQLGLARQLAQAGEAVLRQWTEASSLASQSADVSIGEVEELRERLVRGAAGGAMTRRLAVPVPPLQQALTALEETPELTGAATQAREERSVAPPHVGSFLAWQDERGAMHCVVVVDMERAEETIRLLCSQYALDETELGETDGGAAGKLVVLELPSDRAEQLIDDMRASFRRLVAKRVARRHVAPGRTAEDRVAASEEKSVAEEAPTGAAVVARAPAVTLPIRDAERRAILQFVHVLKQHKGTQKLQGPVRGSRNRQASRPAANMERASGGEALSQGTGRGAQERRSTERVMVFLYFVPETAHASRTPR